MGRPSLPTGAPGRSSGRRRTTRRIRVSSPGHEASDGSVGLIVSIVIRPRPTLPSTASTCGLPGPRAIVAAPGRGAQPATKMGRVLGGWIGTGLRYGRPGGKVRLRLDPAAVPVLVTVRRQRGEHGGRIGVRQRLQLGLAQQLALARRVGGQVSSRKLSRKIEKFGPAPPIRTSCPPQCSQSSIAC